MDRYIADDDGIGKSLNQQTPKTSYLYNVYKKKKEKKENLSSSIFSRMFPYPQYYESHSVPQLSSISATS